MDCLHEITFPGIVRYGDQQQCQKCGKVVMIELLTTPERNDKTRREFNSTIKYLSDKFPVILRKQWSGGEVQKWIREQDR